ncbi:MAG: DOMON domain-containing protein [Solirubrobacteraceae bacterium]
MSLIQVIDVGEDPRDPCGAVWEDLPAEVLTLAPVPLEAQPNEYIRTAWAGRPYGRVGEVRAAAARFGERLSVHLEWRDDAEPNVEFPDGAGVFFPDPDDESSPATIGTRPKAVRLWAWRERLAVQGSLAAGRELLANGPGVFRPAGPTPNAELVVESALAEGSWRVVMTGDERAATGGRAGIVVWDGSNEERAGIGAVTHEWVGLSLGGG